MTAPWIKLANEFQEHLEAEDKYYQEENCMRRLRKDFDVMFELNPRRLINYLCDGAERVDRECLPK